MSSPPPAAPPAGRFAETRSIGRRSRVLKSRHLLGRIWRALASVIAVILAALALGTVIGGIGFGGLFFTALACVLVAALVLWFPRLRAPTRLQLLQGPLVEIVGKAELWLETRRKDLPPRAAQMVDHIGIQLDGLGLHLDQVAEHQPVAAEIRELVGEHLPGIVASYAATPVASDDEVLVDDLARISGEIDAIARQLASGSLDDLALKARHIDLRNAQGRQAP